MSRIPTPVTIEAAPVTTRPLLEAVKKQLGVVPNMFRLISNKPPRTRRLSGTLQRPKQGGAAGGDPCASGAGGGPR